MAKTYSIQIPTKPYLKKYIESLYGSPTVFTKKNFFGMCLMGFLDRKFYNRDKDVIIHQAFNAYTVHLTLFLPRIWLLASHYGQDLPPQNVINLNRLMQERFEEDLYKHCQVLTLTGIDIKDALEDFCRLHDISIEEDISFESLKKKEYRIRKLYEKKYIPETSFNKKMHQRVTYFR